MQSFSELNIPAPLLNALEESGITKPTPVQTASFKTIASGKDVVGIAQTGTGKTLAYLLPLVRDLKFSKELHPRLLILVPTRELAVQVLNEITKLTTYTSTRALAVYGGVNINTHKQEVEEGVDVLVATPGRLYDLAISRAVQLKLVRRVVIDEVDEMLDMGFRPQLQNLFELLPERRQNVLFSATMTDDVELIIDDYFVTPEKIVIAQSGERLKNIDQQWVPVPNFYTKVNLLIHLLQEDETFSKVLVFVGNKKSADRLFEALDGNVQGGIAVIHSNKTQNYRLRSIEGFGKGDCRVLVATDLVARGIDIEDISHVISFDTPEYPENYIHRIGRTGRAEKQGITLLFCADKELELKAKIEQLMSYEIPSLELPAWVEVSQQAAPEDRVREKPLKDPGRNNKKKMEPGEAFHDKKDKNKKVNLGGAHKRKMAAKYKKPQSRGDKGQHKRKK